MPKSLIVTEKPSVARDIVAALGGFSQLHQTPVGATLWESDQYIVGHALGHLLELYEPEDYAPHLKLWKSQDLPVIPEAFLLKPKAQTAQLLRCLKQQMNRPDVTEIINACDAAREGELIFREILQHAGTIKPCSRVWLQSLIPEAIRASIANRKPQVEYQGLANAAHGRAQSDWLIGMNLSRAATLKLSRASEGGVWSIGRVQTPTLAMLVEREFSIIAHNPNPFQILKAKFTASDHVYEGTWGHPNFKYNDQAPELKKHRIFNEDFARKLVGELSMGSSAGATDVRRSREQKAPPFFSLTSLQRYMANQFKWTAKHTIDVAQKCYEQFKVITYPRTESEALPSDYVERVREILEKLVKIPCYENFANGLLTEPWSNVDRNFCDLDVTDHFAIIPTGVFPAKLPKDEGMLFDAVIRRFMAAMMRPCILDIVERKTVVNNHTFHSGPEEIVKDHGWMSVSKGLNDDPRGKEKPHMLMPLDPNGTIVLSNLKLIQEQTKPPHRISEGHLLTLMEHAGRQVDDPEQAKALKACGGLGTAATRAEIIENLKNKEFIFNNLQPTVKGMHLIRFLKLARVHQLITPAFTAELELHLSHVESNSRGRESFISEVTSIVESSLSAVTCFDIDSAFQQAPALGSCPRCQNVVHERMWNYSCKSNYDTSKACGFVLPKDCDGRWLDPRSVERLLKSSESSIVVDNFPTTISSDSSTKRQLKIVNGSLVILHESGLPMKDDFSIRDNESAIRRRVTWGGCPVHIGDSCLIIETKNAFICETRLRHLREGVVKSDGFQLPKSICDKRLKVEDINAFIEAGKTRKIEGFKSKSGKIFDAVILRSATGQWTFDFRS